MPFYVVMCRYNSNEFPRLEERRLTLGYVEGASAEAAKTEADRLVGELKDANEMNGHHAFPNSNFYFWCEPVEPIGSVEDILRLHARVFEKSYHWHGKLKDLNDGKPA